MRDYVVLITGATSGIGLSFAKVFAKRGNNLIIVASNKDRLKKVQDALHRAYHVSVEAICQDLSEANAASKIYTQVKEMGYIVDILINNAGFGLAGKAMDIDYEQEERMLAVNITAMTQLCHIFLKDMCRLRDGKILNVASTGAFQPGPYTAAYFASKAYVASYSRAIRYEAEPYGVSVSTLYPGTTRTSFFEKEGKETPFWAMDPDKLARMTYVKMMENEEMIVPGIMNKILRFVPAKIKIFFIAKMKK